MIKSNETKSPYNYTYPQEKSTQHWLYKARTQPSRISMFLKKGLQTSHCSVIMTYCIRFASHCEDRTAGESDGCRETQRCPSDRLLVALIKNHTEQISPFVVLQAPIQRLSVQAQLGVILHGCTVINCYMSGLCITVRIVHFIMSNTS